MFSRPREWLRPVVGFRLSLWYAAFFVFGTLALLSLAYTLLAWSLRDRDRELIRLTLADYAALYESDGLEGLRLAILTQQEMGHAPDLFVRVIGQDGEAIFLSSPTRWAPFDLGQLLKPPAPGEPGWSRLPARADEAVLEVANLRFNDGTLLEVGVSSKARESTLALFRRWLIVLTVLTLVVGVGGGVLLTRWTIRPVRDLTHTVKAIIETGALAARVPIRQSGEALDDLADLVNAMLDRIERLVAGMKDSLDNVAHDLRTPLMRVQAIAEGALGARSPEEFREALGGVLEENDRVARTLESLMDIAEAETGAMRLEREIVPVTQMVEEVIALYADLAEDRGIALHASIPDGLKTYVDRNRVRQALANVVDNAVKYTPGNGTIDIAAARDGGDVILTVADTGPGIATEDLPRIWDRLYRGNRSRTERGLGLGLSLVRAIVAAHGGRVEARSELGSGTCFTLRFPDAHSSAD